MDPVTAGPGRRVKIVCTLGPSTADPDTVVELAEAGMDVARLNLSYGSPEDHRRAVEAARRAAERSGRTVAVLADLRGAKLRLGRFERSPVALREGERFVLTTDEIIGSPQRVTVGPHRFFADVKPAEHIVLRDGRVVLEVSAVSSSEIHTRVVRGGEVTDKAGVHLPNTDMSTPALTGRDVDDLHRVLSLGVDLVALSFVDRADDADAVRDVMDRVGARVPVIAKLERRRAIEKLDEVTRSFDAVMVARGDLGTEVPLEEVPIIQKRAITTARRRARPAIVATEMLESMIRGSRPTRAEASDVANAVFDGADALMLSGETAVGAQPVEVVRTMARIIDAAERAAAYAPVDDDGGGRDDAVARAAVDITHKASARWIVVFTESGSSAGRVARYRPSTPIAAFTPERGVTHQLALTWGVHPFAVPRVGSTDEMIEQVDRRLVSTRTADPGDEVVIVAGTPIGVTGSTNLVRVHTVGTR